MQLPAQITTRGVRLEEREEEKIRQRIAQLDRYYDRIVSCRVAVDTPGRHHQRGGPYSVRIEIHVPGAALVADRTQEEDLESAVQAAFDAARRRLEDYARRQRGTEKAHEERPTAVIARLNPRGGYGFLATSDGREVYFHENSVLPPGFSHLHVGAEVRFLEELGTEGPQATTVEFVREAV